MDHYLHSIDTCDLNSVNTQHAITALESGRVIYMPSHAFSLHDEEQIMLSESILDGQHKNISYDPIRQRLGGLAQFDTSSSVPSTIERCMKRYAEYAKHMVDTLLPQYSSTLRWGRTSYRPAEVKGRASSKRRDDTRVHVDSFSSTPVHGMRILRVFCNINPDGKPRSWDLGEPFPNLLKTFSPKISAYNRTIAHLLQLVKVTKTLRSPYDHYMLKLHDTMKLDDHYQQTLLKKRVDFPPQTTWMVFTDHVSHAALSGQFLLEQTFYVPVSAMLDPALSPLKQWEQEKLAVLS